MGLNLPTDHGSQDTWDVVLDAVFNTIDSHDHSPGKGVLIPAAALNINADVSWSSGGTSHAITDLNAVDFRAVATSVVTSLAGALFLNSADSNLWWRTVGGTNVQLTNGAALNVSAFAGGIGGDYSAVGALEIFDDATDSYWFQQQLGGGVRQYARMRCADVDLYEYKANPAAGVPTNRVRLASPTSLAASYAVTWPAALPASTRELFIDPTGVGGFVAPLRTALIPAVGGIGSSSFGTIGGSTIIRTGASGGTYYRQLEFDAGHRFVNMRVRLKDAAGTTCTATLVRDVDGTQSTISTIGTSAGSGAYQTLTASAINHTLTTGGQYAVAFTFAGAAANCDLNKIEVDYDRP